MLKTESESEVGLGWHALYTRHQHEKAVAHVLTNKGLEVFLPLYTATHAWKDRRKTISVPLFPCYVFIREGVKRWVPVMTTPGIHSVVSWAGSPAVIPHAEVDAIRRAVENCSSVEPHPFLKDGDWIRVRSGPLEGIEGVLVRRKNQLRLVLSVEMLGKSASVEVDIVDVERATKRREGSTIAGRSVVLSPAERREKDAELAGRGWR